MARRIRQIVTASLAAFVSYLVSGQPAAPAPVFEAASIRVADPRQPIDMNTFPSGRLEATNVTLKQLIEAAYNFKSYLISGGPAWLDSDRFDVSAKANEEAAQDKSRVLALGRDAPLRMMLMLQTLLEDRFKVKVHRDTRQDTVYDLVVAKGGAKLKKSASSDGEQFVGVGRDCRPCDFTKPASAMILGARRGTMTMLADRLSRFALGRPVRDKTGILGEFDFDVHYAGDDTQPDAGSSIFTAIQEQIGLRLEAKKEPVESLFIDLAEKPSEN
jgi:uncharacterized protein (TIGR03435 family)